MLAIEAGGVAVITGAASGIGKETAFEFAEAGALGVVFADRHEAAARDIAEKSKEFAVNPYYQAIAVCTDVTNPESVQEMVDTTIKTFGRVDYSVNCAGIGPTSSNTIADVSQSELDAMLNVNLKGTINSMSAVTRAMMMQEPRIVKGRNGDRSIGHGSIVNISSANGYVAQAGKGPYIASKFGVIGVTKTAAIENSKYGIRVNALCPGPVDTPMMGSEMERAPYLKEAIAKMTPMGRMGKPEEIAQMALFLSSQAGSYINGVGMMIDGGITLALHTG